MQYAPNQTYGGQNPQGAPGNQYPTRPMPNHVPHSQFGGYQVNIINILSVLKKLGKCISVDVGKIFVFLIKLLNYKFQKLLYRTVHHLECTKLAIVI